MADPQPDPHQEKQPGEEGKILQEIPLDSTFKKMAAELSDTRNGVELMYQTTVEAVMRAYEFRLREWTAKKAKLFEGIKKTYELPTRNDLEYVLDLDRGVVLVKEVQPDSTNQASTPEAKE